MIFIYSYVIGTIISTNVKTITIENNGFGYYLFVSDPSRFKVNEQQKIYLFKRNVIGQKNNFLEELYGFLNYEQKLLFIKLIQVPGIGPKTAMTICQNKPDVVMEMVTNKDVQSLQHLKGITTKIAKQLVENIEIDKKFKSKSRFGDLIEALKSLGYIDDEINFAINEIKSNSTELSDLIADCIKIISRKTNFENFKT